MNDQLKKKLIINALNQLNEYFGNAGCNDLYPDSPLLNGISKEELKEVEKEWIKLFPDESKDYDSKMYFDTNIVDTLVKLVE